MEGGTLNADSVTAANMRRLREAKGWSQEVFAQLANERLAVDWTRDHVATIERGQRRLSVGEVLALAHMFKVDLAELLTAESWIELTPGMRAKAWKAGRFAKVETTTPERTTARLDTEAERKAARALETSTALVRGAARKLWKLSLDEERERRVKERVDQAVNPLTARGTQALRGHVARELYEELREALKRKR